MAEMDGILEEADLTLSAVMRRVETIIKTKAMPKERATLISFTHCEYTKSKARMQRLCGQLKQRHFFTKVYVHGAIDESQSDMASVSEDTGIEDSKTPERNGGVRRGSNSISNCENCIDFELNNNTENKDSENDGDEDVHDGSWSEGTIHVSDSDTSGSVQIRSPIKRRRTRQTASRCKLKTKTTKAKANGSDCSDRRSVMAGASPVKKRCTCLCAATKEKHPFGVPRKGNTCYKARILVRFSRPILQRKCMLCNFLS